MKRVLPACCLLTVAFGMAAGASQAQERPAPEERKVTLQRRDPQPEQELDANPLSDALLEVDAKKNLKAAQLYYTRKAYIGALQRCEETIAVYQRFKKFDEVLYIAGMSSARLSRKEGKQPPTLATEKYLVLARQYLTQLVNEHPKSNFRKRAEAELQSLGDAKP
ncbi:MAG TPA: outer membrane protein assembly factor BamD [Pyrinomonadaceae bacterium]|nr:outer membrane protein assembly factor BamD [Pyrinomonadaceae bacterium]